jgi:hypothetical protein
LRLKPSVLFLNCFPVAREFRRGDRIQTHRG